MPTNNQPNPSQNPEAAPDTTLEGMPAAAERETLKTIAVRVPESVHAQLAFIAHLSETSITEEIRTAIDARIAGAQADPKLIERAQKAREEIEREAAARTAAIAGFMGKTALAGTSKASSETTGATANPAKGAQGATRGQRAPKQGE